jgi:hypothetical protein
MTEEKIYSGGCHCGQVRFDLTASIAKAYECNCSLCAKRGILWDFIDAERFTLKSGESALKDYLFNKKTIHHLFCTTCGVASFSRGARPDGAPVVAINLRCLDDIDLSALERVPVDGKSA